MSYPACETERIAGCEDEDNECHNERHNQVWHADKFGNLLPFVEWSVHGDMTATSRIPTAPRDRQPTSASWKVWAPSPSAAGL
jgi:hypothetical protein